MIGVTAEESISINCRVSTRKPRYIQIQCCFCQNTSCKYSAVIIEYKCSTCYARTAKVFIQPTFSCICLHRHFHFILHPWNAYNSSCTFPVFTNNLREAIIDATIHVIVLSCCSTAILCSVFQPKERDQEKSL